MEDIIRTKVSVPYFLLKTSVIGASSLPLGIMGGVNTEKKLDKNDVHYYVARDKGGIIWLFMGKPIRRTEFFHVLMVS